MSFHVQVDDLDAVIWAKRHVERDPGDKAPRGHKHAYARNLLDLQRHALVVGGKEINDRWKLVEEEVGCGRLPIRSPFIGQQLVEPFEEGRADADLASAAHPVAMSESVDKRLAVLTIRSRNPGGMSDQSVTRPSATAAARSSGVISSKSAAVITRGASAIQPEYRVGARRGPTRCLSTKRPGIAINGSERQAGGVWRRTMLVVIAVSISVVAGSCSYSHDAWFANPCSKPLLVETLYVERGTEVAEPSDDVIARATLAPEKVTKVEDAFQDANGFTWFLRFEGGDLMELSKSDMPEWFVGLPATLCA